MCNSSAAPPRQGIGKQLLDLTKEVAKGARARMMWLNVADYNPNAIAFYREYGFQKTEVQSTRNGGTWTTLMS